MGSHRSSEVAKLASVLYLFLFLPFLHLSSHCLLVLKIRRCSIYLFITSTMGDGTINFVPPIAFSCVPPSPFSSYHVDCELSLLIHTKTSRQRLFWSSHHCSDEDIGGAIAHAEHINPVGSYPERSQKPSSPCSLASCQVWQSCGPYVRDEKVPNVAAVAVVVCIRLPSRSAVPVGGAWPSSSPLEIEPYVEMRTV